MRVTDEWLYEKMPIVDAAMVKRLEDDIDKEYVFSDKPESVRLNVPVH